MRISDWSSDVYSSDLALAWVDEDIGVATERLEFTIARRRLQRTHAGGTDGDHAPTTGATGRHRIDDILADLQPFAMHVMLFDTLHAHRLKGAGADMKGNVGRFHARLTQHLQQRLIEVQSCGQIGRAHV